MHDATQTTLPLDRLDAYLAPVLRAGRVVSLKKLSVGQSNPTYFLDTESGAFVLRRKPDGALLPSAHAIDREYRIQQVLGRQAGFPVAEMLHYCDDAGVIGTPFYVMKRLIGRVFIDCQLPEVAKVERRSYYQAFAETLARLHGIDWQAEGLADFGRPGNYFARQVARWSGQWQDIAQSTSNPALDQLGPWLQSHLPEPGHTAIAHGDFKWDNLIFHPEQPKVIGILDWELSTLGDPMADLAYSCMPWHIPPNRYGGIAGLNLSELGLPTRDEYVAVYSAAAGTAATLTPFHLAFAMFRFAVIVEGVGARGRGGNASNADAIEVGKLGRVYAEAALAVIG